ncbi:MULTISPECIES: alpha-glucosidase [Cohnella]|uniref:alpha-glucosidase n=1 Tax=Cohnella TaxID=329857 RepID=UPI0009B947B1|nr:MULTISPECIES: alpha-glucosidase [Cohnella]MBN2981948.1 alpha-glucosidase [Cohnella algarum]
MSDNDTLRQDRSADEAAGPWWKESVAYQIYPRSFQDSNGDGVGDIRGIIDRLDYLQFLGIDLLWICPVYDSPNDDNGYDIRDFHAILAEFGTMKDMDELLAQAKRRGIRILMDLVANHTSDEHAWFVESRCSKDNPKRDWYIWKPGKDGKEPTNWECGFSGSAWEYDETTDEYFLHCFSRRQPDLNWENPDVREAIYRMMEWWMDKGIAGFRVDAVTFIKKNQAYPQLESPDGRPYVTVNCASLNQPGILDFLGEMKERVLAPRGVVTVAEAPGVPIEEIPRYVDEKDGVFSMLFQFDHIELDLEPGRKGVLRSFEVKEFKAALAKWQYESNKSGWLGLFLENHDSPRSVSKFGNDGAYRSRSAKALAAYYFLMRGTPFIFQGQEIGMTNGSFDSIDEYRDIESVNLYRVQVEQDPEATAETAAKVMHFLANRSRDHGRTPMQWNGGHAAGFTSGTPWLKLNPNYAEINVEREIKDESSVLHFYRKLIALRRGNKALVYGAFEEIHEDSPEIGGYVRTLGEERWTVLCNFTDRAVAVAEPAGAQLVLTNADKRGEGVLAPYEAVVFKQ